MAAKAAQQERSRQTRKQLLEAALSTLSDDGVAATTVSAVAQRAGVSRGAAQYHFPTRDSLLEAMLEEFFTERTQQLRRSVADLPSGPEGAPVRDVVSLVFSFYDHRPFRAVLHVWSAAGSDPELREKITPAEARYGREVFQLTALALNADLSDTRTRRLIGLTLDLARGLGLASVLVDNRSHRDSALTEWAGILSGIKRND